MASFDRPAIEPLDVDNYATWSVKMRFLLVTRDLWSPVVNNELVDQDQDAKALALMALYVDDPAA